MSQLPNINLQEIMKSAQLIANNISENDKQKINGMNMDQMFEHVTDTVLSGLEQQKGQQLDAATKSQVKFMSKNMLSQFINEDDVDISDSDKNSKVDLSGLVKPKTETQEPTRNQNIPTRDSNVEEIADDESVLELRPYVKDIHYSLPVTLEECYMGKTKKIAVKTNRLDKTGKKVHEEKRKLQIPIYRGSLDGQEIRLHREGNEKPGYESGDIVITLSETNHSVFERHGSTLYTVKNISLYESYAAGRGDIKIVIQHLDGSYLILREENGIPLHSRDGSRKVKNGGMPVYGSTKNEYGDLYIRFNVILPETFEGPDGERAIGIIEKLFPILPGNKETLVYKEKSNQDKYGFKPLSSSKCREIRLEETTEEDMEQLYYEEDRSEESEESEESEQSEESEESEEEEKHKKKGRKQYRERKDN
jgi:DnaJ-class molecular chaperone